ncbi:alkene reductase [Vitiosangium sp. GDMCC 1.1324]|uniref:alkene reductase n=1 Tax=Vitiosangium sp. (strain GDMCC 1.1324) TaxID=2138576 RepID=UPI000D34E085|nr:alkene reductase [Vitiosangium sp. GDMCC 1.1324]PTL85927.1 alkene reductase [Vitiosangium sp. GDMCC 1.1324]
MANPSKLLSPFRLGRLELKNRLVMAPMTRSRALVDGNVPNPLAATYYQQRASAGLLITEATQVSPQGVGYIRTPGMHSPQQVAGWRKVTDSVHAVGGVIFAQLWHVGRVSHPDFHDGQLPVAPSALSYEGEVFTFKGKTRIVTPRALETGEIPGIVEQFRRAAENAREAGFDGVELHGSNGYLLDQFLRDGSNQRTDAYGGSIENRARFPLEVARAVVGIWGAERVGYRLSPQSFPYAGMTDSTPAETFTYMARELSRLGLGYLHVTEAVSGNAVPSTEQRITPLLRKAFQGTLIVNGGYDARAGEEALARGEADLVAYGVPFLANPDLPERFRREAPLNPPDAATFFTGEEKGYTDYPALR